MEPELTLAYDLKKSAEVTVTLTFAADAQLLDPDKAHLEEYVRRHHLLTQAANLCAKFAAIEMATQGKDVVAVVAEINAEKTKRLAEVEAEYAAKVAMVEAAAEKAEDEPTPVKAAAPTKAKKK